MNIRINSSCFCAHAKGAIIYPWSTFGASSSQGRKTLLYSNHSWCNIKEILWFPSCAKFPASLLLRKEEEIDSYQPPEEGILISSTRKQWGGREDELVAAGSSAGAEPCSPGKPAVRRALCSSSGQFRRDREFKHISNWIADVFSDGYLGAKLWLKQQQRDRTGWFSVIKLMAERMTIYCSLHQEHNTGRYFKQDFWGRSESSAQITQLPTPTPRDPDCTLDWKAADSNLNNAQISSSPSLPILPDEQQVCFPFWGT